MKFVGMTKDEQPSNESIYKALCEEIKLRERGIQFSEDEEQLQQENILYLRKVADTLRIKIKSEAMGKSVPTDKLLLKGAMNWLCGDSRHTTKKVDRVDTFDYSDKDINATLDEWGYGV